MNVISKHPQTPAGHLRQQGHVEGVSDEREVQIGRGQRPHGHRQVAERTAAAGIGGRTGERVACMKASAPNVMTVSQT